MIYFPYLCIVVCTLIKSEYKNQPFFLCAQQHSREYGKRKNTLSKIKIQNMPLSIKISELTLRLEEFSVSPKSTLIILGRCHSGRLTTTLRWMESRYNTSEYPHHTNLSHGPFIAYSVKGLTVVRTYAYELFGSTTSQIVELHFISLFLYILRISIQQSQMTLRWLLVLKIIS